MDINKSMDFNYEKSEIPEELIKECESLSSDDNTYFIFNDIDETIKLVTSDRDETLEIILDESNKETPIYYIGDIDEFNIMPSRFSYYDTETKLINLKDKYNFVVDFILNLSAEPSISNFGMQYEQAFIITVNNKRIIIRVSPNLFIKIEMYSDSIGVIYKDFFNKKRIYESLSKSLDTDFKSIIRDSRINNILT